uniref:SCP domain-containing protein n=1 Tax=Mesocestoides corti TaxID=53468 RepID=A0A5K3ER43_MESCO
MQWTANCTDQKPNSTLLPNHTNIAVTWTQDLSINPTYDGAMNVFSNPFNNYNYETNTCKRNCRLYIQYVWANTTEVGCGMTQCNKRNGNAVTPITVVACVYHPAGNIPGLRPYANGTRCSACPQGFFCYRNQCTNDTSLLPNTTTTPTTSTTISTPTAAATNTATNTTTSTTTSTAVSSTTAATNTATNTTTTDIGTSTSVATTMTSISSPASIQGILFYSLLKLLTST